METHDREGTLIKGNVTFTILTANSFVFTGVNTPQSEEDPTSKKALSRLPLRAKVEVVPQMVGSIQEIRTSYIDFLFMMRLLLSATNK